MPTSTHQNGERAERQGAGARPSLSLVAELAGRRIGRRQPAGWRRRAGRRRVCVAAVGPRGRPGRHSQVSESMLRCQTVPSADRTVFVVSTCRSSREGQARRVWRHHAPRRRRPPPPQLRSHSGHLRLPARGRLEKRPGIKVLLVRHHRRAREQLQVLTRLLQRRPGHRSLQPCQIQALKGESRAGRHRTLARHRPAPVVHQRHEAAEAPQAQPRPARRDPSRHQHSLAHAQCHRTDRLGRHQSSETRLLLPRDDHPVPRDRVNAAFPAHQSCLLRRTRSILQHRLCRRGRSTAQS